MRELKRYKIIHNPKRMSPNNHDIEHLGFRIASVESKNGAYKWAFLIESEIQLVTTEQAQTIADLQANITTLAGEMFGEWGQSLLANLDDEKEKNKYLDIACDDYYKQEMAQDKVIADLQAEIEHLQETIKQGTDALEAARIRLDVCGG